MVLFGQNPSQGTLLKASQFLSGEATSFLLHKIILTSTEELPVRLAHRVKELDELPHNLSAMPSINKVKNWYAQSFEASPFLRLSTYSCEHPNRNSLLSLPLSYPSASVKHSWYPAQMKSHSLNQNPILHNPVLSTKISTPTLTAIVLINSSYVYRWNEGIQLAPFSFHPIHGTAF